MIDMNEKRFKLMYINEQYISANIFDNKTFIASVDIGGELLVELLNILHDENEQLQSFKEQNIREYTKLKKVCNECKKENEQLKQQLKRCKDWINSDKYDYELTLAFIKNKGYSLKDVLEYEKELKRE